MCFTCGTELKLRHLVNGWLPVWLTGNGNRACVWAVHIQRQLDDSAITHYMLCVHRFGGSKSVACRWHRFVATGKHKRMKNSNKNIYNVSGAIEKRRQNERTHSHEMYCVRFRSICYNLHCYSLLSTRTHCRECSAAWVLRSPRYRCDVCFSSELRRNRQKSRSHMFELRTESTEFGADPRTGERGKERPYSK